MINFLQHARVAKTAARRFATASTEPTKKTKSSFGAGIRASRSIDSPMLTSEARSERAIDGNTAAAHVAYAMSDVSFIYPISPSTSMGETMDKYSNSGRKNVFGQIVKVKQMQSELGSAGALHGALSGGSLCTTFTASQGLLLMIPNMYLCAGELLPAVFHVSARALARHSLSIFNDHSDIMAVRTTGVAILGASNAQEVMDMSLVSHLSALKSSVPFVNWFDGFRTSAVITTVKPISYSTIKSLMPWDALENFRSRGLNPQHPHMRGLGQDPQVYYQGAVSANRYYDAVPEIVEETMEEVYGVTGRHYKLFEYYGAQDADRVIVLMGSGSKSAEETIDYMVKQGEKVGMIRCRLFRPFSVDHFIKELPESCKAIAVLDKTKEDMAASLPLHADVVTSLADAGLHGKTVVGGNYGLGSKEFSPMHVKAVFDNLSQKVPKNHFTTGIVDDVTNSHIPVGQPFSVIPKDTKQCLFFGLGSDGTVGANKQATAIIGERTEFHSQGHFNYSSQKAGGTTVSHLRFGPTPIRAEYEIEAAPGADYVACHNPVFLPKFEMLTTAKVGGTFLVNCPWTTLEDVSQEFPAKLRRDIAEKKLELYTIDAHKVAASVGLPAKRISQVMQGCFFHLSEILPADEAKVQLEASVDRLFGRKSPQIVSSNKEALTAGIKQLNKIKYDSSWLTAEETERSTKRMYPSKTKYTPQLDEFSATFLKGITGRTAGELPTSAFKAGGEQPIGQTLFEKRGLAEEVPIWYPDTCTQCNLCSIVCPHAVVRPFLLNKSEQTDAPEGYQSRKAKGGELGGLHYTIQLSPYDCTGCAICVEMCPDDSLEMKPALYSQDKHNEHWEYSVHVIDMGAGKKDRMDKYSVKGSQFVTPLMEFSGACSGCGETPYVKLITQMFGDRMVIANASGCSSVWGGSFGISPFTKNEHGQGPAWARSLFEDNAEYGLGMQLGSQQRREKVIEDVQELLDLYEDEQTASKALVGLLTRWLDVVDNPDKCIELNLQIRKLLAEESASPEASDLLLSINANSDMLVKPSHWIIGGDGWAYDIGFGGVDHVLASDQDVNVLVLDTEGYSNTGAQVSKATPMGASMKNAVGGQKSNKKDLGAIAMMHENAYVASVSLAADVLQTCKAFKEAEAYNGPSLIVAYSTCVDWGHRWGDKAMVSQMQQVVDSGYWPLYRYHPDKIGVDDQTGFELDSKRTDPKAMDKFLASENRFTSLLRAAPDNAKEMQAGLVESSNRRHETRKRKAMNDEDLLEYLKKQMGEQVTGERVTVLYGSDTGNAELVAKSFQMEMKGRGMKAKVMAFDDISVEDLADQTKILAVVATAGQGDMPGSAKKFWPDMEAFLETAPADFMKDTQFAVFGMGDSSYVFFNESAKQIDGAFEKLGGQRLMPTGMADDQHPARYDTELEEWTPDFYDSIDAPPPPQILPPASHEAELLDAADEQAARGKLPYIPHESTKVRLTTKLSTVPEGYERPIDHFEFDLSGSGLSYEQGDSLGVWPSNKPAQVDMMMQALGLKGDECLRIKALDSNRSVPLPEVVSVQTLFSDMLDIQGWPKRRFYEMMKLSATDPVEKETLEKLCSKEGKSIYQDYGAESYTYAELLKKFPSAVPSIATLLDYIPDLKPRLYSIASSSRLRGQEECHLCIIRNDWWGKETDRFITGLTTGWLDDLVVPDEGIVMNGCTHLSAVTMPETHKTAMVMVGLGTGIAPMRAFIEERAQAKRDGEECAPMALFFGARNRQEYSYEKEFDEYQKEGVLEHIHLALSREQKEKIYVTHRLAQEAELLYDLIHERHGNLYLCGPGGNVPPQVRAALISAIHKCGGHTEEYAEKYVMEMQINGRYNVEAW